MGLISKLAGYLGIPLPSGGGGGGGGGGSHGGGQSTGDMPQFNGLPIKRYEQPQQMFSGGSETIRKQIEGNTPSLGGTFGSQLGDILNQGAMSGVRMENRLAAPMLGVSPFQNYNQMLSQEMTNLPNAVATAPIMALGASGSINNERDALGAITKGLNPTPAQLTELGRQADMTYLQPLKPGGMFFEGVDGKGAGQAAGIFENNMGMNQQAARDMFQNFIKDPVNGNNSYNPQQLYGAITKWHGGGQ